MYHKIITTFILVALVSSTTFAKSSVGLRSCTYDQYQSHENLLIFERSDDDQYVSIKAVHREVTEDLGQIPLILFKKLNPHKRNAAAAGMVVAPLAIGAIGLSFTLVGATIGLVKVLSAVSTSALGLPISIMGAGLGTIGLGVLIAANLPDKTGLTPQAQRQRALMESCLIKASSQGRSVVQLSGHRQFELIVHNIKDLMKDLKVDQFTNAAVHNAARSGSADHRVSAVPAQLKRTESASAQ